MKRHDFRWWRYELQAKEYLTSQGHEAIHWPDITVELARKVGLEWDEERLNWRYHSNGTCADIGSDVLQVHKDGSLQNNQPKLFFKTKVSLRRLGTAFAVSFKLNAINRMRGLKDHPLRVFVPPGTRHTEDLDHFIELKLLEIVYMDYEEPTPPVLPPFQLRDFQVKAVEFLANNPQALIHAPTGAGKTQILIELINTLIDRITIVASPTKFLVDQTASRMEEAGLQCKIIHSDAPAIQEEGYQVISTTYDSLEKAMAGVQDPYLVADECHLKPASQEGWFHLEMSATPCPSTMPTFTVKRSTLVQQGILPHLQAKVPLELTTASTSSFKGDTRITAEAVFFCECLLENQVHTNLSFFSTVQECQDMKKCLEDQKDYPFEFSVDVVTADTPRQERAAILKSTLGFRGSYIINEEGIRLRQVRIVLSVRTMCEGTELPQLDSVYISSMVVRQGNLTALKVQCIGRLREGRYVYIGVPFEQAGPIMAALQKDDLGFADRIKVVNTDWKRAHLPQMKAKVESATRALADKTRILSVASGPEARVLEAVHAAVEWAKEAGALPTKSGQQQHYMTLQHLKNAEQGLGHHRAWSSAIAFADRELPYWREVTRSVPVVEDKAQHQVDRARVYVQWQRQHGRPPSSYGGKKSSDLKQAQLQERKVALIFTHHRGAYLKVHQGTGTTRHKWYPEVATVYEPTFGPQWFTTIMPRLV